MSENKPKKLRSSGKGRGWNLRKGAQDYGKTNAVEAGRAGGLRKVKKGFAVAPYDRSKKKSE